MSASRARTAPETTRGPRNRIAWNRSQEERERIRAAYLTLIQRNPFARPTAKDIACEIETDLSDRTIRWHLACLRAETDVSVTETAIYQSIEAPHH